MTDTELLNWLELCTERTITCSHNSWLVKATINGFSLCSSWRRTLFEAIREVYNEAHEVSAIEDESLLPIPLDEGI